MASEVEITGVTAIAGAGRSYTVSVPIVDPEHGTEGDAVVQDPAADDVAPLTNFGLTQVGDAFVPDLLGVVGQRFGQLFEVQGQQQREGHTTISFRNLATGAALAMVVAPGLIADLKTRQTTVDPSLLVSIVRAGWRLLRWEDIQVEFVPDPGGDARPFEVDLPVLRVHCPRNKGCTATYAVTSSGGEKASASVKFLGVNGGNSREVTWNVTEEYEADAKSCTEVVVKAKVTLEVGSIRITVPKGFRDAHGVGPHLDTVSNAIYVSIDDIDQERRTPVAIPPERDYCQWTLAKAAAYPKWPGGSEELVGKAKKVGLDRAAKTSGRIGLGLSLERVPLSFGIDFESTTSHASKVTTNLTSGARYLAYAPSVRDDPDNGQFFEVCWTTQ
jgi:hypothetical protein